VTKRHKSQRKRSTTKNHLHNYKTKETEEPGTLAKGRLWREIEDHGQLKATTKHNVFCEVEN